jgi:hypothetical protein
MWSLKAELSENKIQFSILRTVWDTAEREAQRRKEAF